VHVTIDKLQSESCSYKRRNRTITRKKGSHIWSWAVHKWS